MRGMRRALSMLALPLVVVVGPALSCVDAHGAAASTRSTIHGRAFTDAGSERPSAPRHVRAVVRRIQGEDTVRVRWRAPKHAGGSRITAYRVIVRIPQSLPSPSKERVKCDEKSRVLVDERICTDRNDDGFDNLRYAVRAKNAQGWGPLSRWSNSVSTAAGAA